MNKLLVTKIPFFKKTLFSFFIVASSINIGISASNQNLLHSEFLKNEKMNYSQNNFDLLQQNKLTSIKTEYKRIETNIPINEALVMTDLEPFCTFQVTNYKYLSNVKAKINSLDLAEIKDYGNGEFEIKALRTGVGFLTINADEVKIPFVTKISIGPFKKADIIYFSEHFIASKRGCFWYSYSYPDKKVIIKHLFNDIWSKPQIDDILFQTSIILVTKYGIFNTEKGIKILNNEFPNNIKKDEIIQVTPYMIATTKGIFKNDGSKLLVYEFTGLVRKSDVILMGGKIIVTNKGVFNSNGTEILIDKFRVPGKLNLLNFFDISSSYSQTLVATSDGVYNSDGIQICTPDILSNYRTTVLNQKSFYKITYAYIFTSYGIYWFAGKFQSMPKNIIDKFDCGIVATDGIYGLKGKKFGESLYPGNISSDDILLSNGSIVFTKKGIVEVGFLYEYKTALTYDSIYAVNSLENNYPGKTYVTYSGLYTSTNKKMNQVCDITSKPIQLLKNEIVEINDNNIITPYSLIFFDTYDPRKSYEFDILKPNELHFPTKSPSNSETIVPIDKTFFIISIWLIIGMTISLLILILYGAIIKIKKIIKK
ncbi:hypothetical protein [Mycoplasmoides alvi]|uniref:hypothetical protein n=1 Tax=Mycoplasmoides alvi TaxID=78580 RepID=UPI00051B84CE|nr:hypothetical protein [Mycoplasmoides alvi]